MDQIAWDNMTLNRLRQLLSALSCVTLVIILPAAILIFDGPHATGVYFGAAFYFGAILAGLAFYSSRRRKD